MNMKGKALLAGCIALVMSSAALAEDIKIAVVGAMSGPVAQYGDQEFTGAEQAVADINAKGGIKGNKLQIVKYDDACDPKTGGSGSQQSGQRRHQIRHWSPVFLFHSAGV